MKKKHELIIISTDKAKNALILYQGVGIKTLQYVDKYLTQEYLQQIYAKSFHLYILSDDEIKEIDWCYHTGRKLIFKNDSKAIIQRERHYYKKIIATTNPDLKVKEECNCFATTFEGCSECLTQIPQIHLDFIKYYITEYNRGNVIKEVDVEYINPLYNKSNAPFKQDLIINIDGTINISIVEDKLYTKEDMLSFGNAVYTEYTKNSTLETFFDKWLKNK